MFLNWKVLRELETQKLIRIQVHPTRPLYIANYTEKVQFDKLWNTHPYLSMCRGIIFDPDGWVWARPFPKFFNLSEHVGPLPKGAFEITTKIDGSMGILYGTGGDDWHIATRGSFDSEQARVANELLHLNHKDAFSWFELDKTYLFEIVYSENRIVVDYGNKRDLILIAVLDTETGRDCNSVKYELESPFFTVEKHLGVGSIEELLSSRWQSRENFEGYVIRWLDNDYRLKVKLEEYLRLHKIMTGVTARRVWEVLAVGDSLDAYLSNTPNEFSDWVLDVAADLFNAYAAIEDESSCTFKMIFNSNRKTFAEQAKSYSYADILFRIYDGKAYADLIWKRIKPAIETPFMKGEDQ